MIKEEYKNIIAFHPGYYLNDIIEDLEMTQDEFAKRLGTSGKTISQLLNGQCFLSNDLAMKISSMLGISVDTLLNLQKQYDEKMIEINQEKEFDEQVEVVDCIDYSFLVKNNLVEQARNKKEKIKNLCSYLHVSNLQILKRRDLLASFRSTVSSITDKNIINANVWLQIALNIGLEQQVKEYNEKKLRASISEIRSMTVQNPSVFLPRLKEIFNDCGVAFVLLPALKNCGVNGVVKWYNGKVVLAINDRFSYVDTFWFSLFHEIKHVFQKKITKVIINCDKSFMEMNQELEQEANLYATETLLPYKDYDEFLQYHNYYILQEDVISFAEKQKIHPGIIVGRLQYDGIIPHSYLNNLKERFRISV